MDVVFTSSELVFSDDKESTKFPEQLLDPELMSNKTPDDAAANTERF